MGLLTKPTTNLGEKNPLVKILEKYGLKFGILMYFIGIGWLIFLANAEYNLGTYFSENALLPGLVVENYPTSGNDNHMGTFLQQLQDKEKAKTLNQADFGELFKSIQITEVGYQNFTILHPINGQNQQRNTKTSTTTGKTVSTIYGTNTFAILRAKRAAGTEALVFSTPYFSRNAAAKKNLVGIAMMLALAEYFQNQIYWAKDIIFLIPDGHIGSLAWVKAHQEIPDYNPYFLYEPVRIKSGNIQAAINVVMESHSICTLETKFHGLNGKLPNLDLVNLMNKFIVKEHEKRANWETDIFKLLGYMQTQATGTPTGSHGFFLKYGIESITLVGKGAGGKGGCKRPYGFGDISRILEATFRSLNNLLERFHQSFFFYLKTTPNRFISIGLYYPPIACILLLIPFKGATLWLTKKEMDTTSGLIFVAGIHTLAIFCRWLLSNAKELLFRDQVEFTPEIFTMLVLSTAALQFLLVQTYVQHQQSKSPTGSGTAATQNSAAVPAQNTAQHLIDGIYCFLLLELATCLYSLALFNPSLVLLIGIPLVGVVIILPANGSAVWSKWVQWVVIIMLIGALAIYYPSVHHFINKYYYENQIYDNFLFDLLFVIFMPIFYTFVAIL